MTQQEFDRKFLKLLSKCTFRISEHEHDNLKVLYISLNHGAFCNFKYDVAENIVSEFWFWNEILRENIPIDPINPTTVYNELLRNTINNLFNLQGINIVC